MPSWVSFILPSPREAIRNSDPSNFHPINPLFHEGWKESEGASLRLPLGARERVSFSPASPFTETGVEGAENAWHLESQLLCGPACGAKHGLEREGREKVRPLPTRSPATSRPCIRRDSSSSHHSVKWIEARRQRPDHPCDASFYVSTWRGSLIKLSGQIPIWMVP